MTGRDICRRVIYLNPRHIKHILTFEEAVGFAGLFNKLPPPFHSKIWKSTVCLQAKKIKYTEIRVATLEWTEIQILCVYLSAKHFCIRRGERSRWRREADMMAKRKKKKDGLIQRQTKLPTLSAKGFLIQHTLMNKWLKVLSAGSWEEHTHSHKDKCCLFN